MNQRIKEKWLQYLRPKPVGIGERRVLAAVELLEAERQLYQALRFGAEKVAQARTEVARAQTYYRAVTGMT